LPTNLEGLIQFVPCRHYDEEIHIVEFPTKSGHGVKV